MGIRYEAVREAGAERMRRDSPRMANRRYGHNRAVDIIDVRRYRDEILALAAKRGATDVRVFGSVVRGDATDDSDVDFLVRFPPGSSYFAQGGLLEELRLLLGRSVDVVNEPELRPAIRDRVLDQAVSL